MPGAVAERTVSWLSGVIDLMRDPTPVMPVRPLLELLTMTFDITGASWNWTQPDGSSGAIVEPPNVLLAEPEFLELWLTGEAWEFHPLVAWFAQPGHVAPTTLARVPSALIPEHKRLVLERPLVRLGLEHQLCIVYRKVGGSEYSFVVTRATLDFDDNDLEVARHVQRSTRSLDQQCAALARLTRGAGSLSLGTNLGLSGRELAVLQLVADGHATRVISRSLACSPRTVEKHLERCFRKLGVRDRLNAVRVARLAGVLGASSVLDIDRAGDLRPGEYLGRVASTGSGPGEMLDHRLPSAAPSR
jgi:DNA-binding CsgD family transcriptional regulator